MFSKKSQSEQTPGLILDSVRAVRNDVPRRMGENGFTLVEVLITLAVVVIVLAVAVPGFGLLIAETRMTTTTNGIVTQLNLARSEAVKRGTPVTMCSSADGATCSGDLDWGSGWIVFTDQDRNLEVNDATDIIRVQQSTENDVELNGNYAYLMYLRDGSMLVY